MGTVAGGVGIGLEAALEFTLIKMLLSNEALFGIELARICNRPDSTESSLGSNDADDDTRGNIPAEQSLSV